MKEKTLLKLALICALVGLFALYFISTKIDVSDDKPATLNKNIGDDVKLQGIVAKVSQANGVIFIEIEQQNPISIVVFSGATKSELSKGDSIEIIGQVQEFNGREEIIANRIRVIR